MKKTVSLLSGLLLAVALAAVVNAQEQRHSSKPWLYKQAKTMEEINALKASDEIAMVCAKCKTVTVVEKGKGVAGLKQGDKEVVYTCKECGEAGFCCVFKKETESGKPK